MSPSIDTRRAGFTLIESLLSLVILTLVASVIGSAYVVGLQSANFHADQILLDSRLRSETERLLSLHYDVLASGSSNITISGKSYTLTWTVSPADVNGDSVADEGAKTLLVTLSGKSITALVVDSAGHVKKI